MGRMWLSENHGIGPIPDERGCGSLLAGLFAAFGFFSVAVWRFLTNNAEPDDSWYSGETHNDYWKAIEYMLMLVSFSLLLIFCGEIIQRLTLLVEEIRPRQFRGRYSGDFFRAVQAVFDSFLLWFSVCFFVPLLILGYISNEHPDLVAPASSSALEAASVFIAAYLIANRCGVRYAKAEVSDVTERSYMNVAHGLAWSYYCGYLALILPGLKERIKRSQHFATSMRVHRLFILMPDDGYCTPDISKADRNITHIGHLEEFKRSRAGNIERSYRNSVYEVLYKGQVEHCVLEFATPLLSLHEMTKFKDAGLTEEDAIHQMKLFVRVLKSILDGARECTTDGSPNFHLLPYKARREDGQPTSLSDIIGETINKLHAEEQMNRINPQGYMN